MIEAEVQNVHRVLIPSVLVICVLIVWLFTSASSMPVKADQPGPAEQAIETVSAAAATAAGGTAGTLSGDCAISTHYPVSIRQWCSFAMTVAAENQLPVNLVAAVMLQESGGNPQAYSASGAVGLLQVMPRDGIAANFKCAAGPCFASRPTIAELLDPQYNLAYGTRLLANLMGRNGGDQRSALRAYGPMDVGFTYADKVLAIYERYQ